MSDSYNYVQAPNIAGSGNYASMLQSGLANLGKPQQQQKPQTQPTSQNYIQQLLQSLRGNGNVAPSSTFLNAGTNSGPGFMNF